MSDEAAIDEDLLEDEAQAERAAALDSIRAGPADFAPSRWVPLAAVVAEQIPWSARTFGPGLRRHALVDHIWRELQEVERAETPEAQLGEWVDVILLAIDGAWRSGASPGQIAEAVLRKQAINRARTWPDWRTADPNRAIEHVEEGAGDA